MPDSARVRDRLLMSVLISAVIHLILLLGPLGPGALAPKPPAIDVALALKTTASPPSQATLSLTRANQAITSTKPNNPAQSQPRYIDGNTEDAPAARYLRDWIVHAERLGNQAYPDALLRQDITGVVVMAVSVDQKGSVLATQVLRGSDDPRLQQAARNLALAAAPYPSVPAAVLAGHEALVITRAWSFGD